MFARYAVLNLPPLPPPPSLGCGGGETRCKSKKNKESPAWVCEKCAKKTAEEKRRGMYGSQMSCGYETPEEVLDRNQGEVSEATLDLGCSECEKRKKRKPGTTSEATLDLGRNDSVGCMSRPPGAPDVTYEASLELGRDGHSIGCPNAPNYNPDETSEATLDLGCDKCQKGKKRRKAAAARAQNMFPSGMLHLNGNGMLGQVPLIDPSDVKYVYEMTSEATLDLGRSGAMLGQVPLIMGNGGRGGGRAFGYDHENEEFPYCDPSVEYCPPPLIGPLLMGQVPLLGDGSGGRSVPYQRTTEDWDEEGWLPYGAYMGSSRKPCLGAHKYMGQTYGCPAQAPALDPTLNCQRDARGNAVCSNGMYFPPGCPHTPPEDYFSPGIAPDEVHNGILEAKVPAPRQAGTTGAAGVPAAGAPGATPGAPAGATPVTSTNVVPIAAGGLAVVGLLYAIFR